MKTKILLLAVTCFCLIAGPIQATPFFQDGETGEVPEPGKKMNFQGTLFENGEPVTGERSFTFTIDLGDGNSWTETHPTVQIVEGLYSVLLGSIDPMPADLFYEFEERDLTISVGNTVLGKTKLLAPFGLNNGRNFQTAEFDLVVKSDADTATLVTRISGIGLTANKPANAIYAGASTDSTNTAIFARVDAGVDNSSFQTGIRSDVVNEGPGWSTPIWGIGTGNGGGTTYGIRGEARGNGNRFSAAARGLNFVESADEPISRYGALFDTRWGSDNTVPILGTSYGVSGVARGSEVNYGIYGSAQGPEGSLNYAGFFQGDVKITNSLFLTNDEGFGSEISNFSVMHRGSDTEVNAMLGNNWIDGGAEQNNRGALFLFADTVERFNRGGADIRRVELRAKDNGWGGSVGALSLRAYDAVKIDADIQTYDGESHFGSLRIDGSTSNNFNFSADGYPDGNLARMTMSGGLAHTDENNNTYVPELVRLWIERFNDGTSDDERAALELKSAFGNRTTTLNTEILEFRKSDYTGNFLSMGTNNQGDGIYLPYMNMQGNLQHDDGQGNMYTPTLFNLNIWKSSDTNEQASLNLNSTEGANANLDVNGLSFGNSEYQPMSLQNNDTGYGRRSPYLRMHSGLKKDDGNGNFYNEQLASLGISTLDENNDRAEMSLRSTAGRNVSLDPTGLNFSAVDYQNMTLNAYPGGFERVNPTLRMTSGLMMDDGNGNFYRPELVSIGINNQDENTDFASLSLGSTDNRGIDLGRNGLNFNGSGYSPMALNIYDDGNGNLNSSFNITGAIQRMDEGQDFSYNPELVSLSGNRWSDTNEVGELRLSATDGTSFSINAYGLNGINNDLRSKNLNIVNDDDTGVISMSSFKDENDYSYGNFSLNGSVVDPNAGMRQFSQLSVQRAYHEGDTDFGANFELNGPTTSNFSIGAKFWEDADLPHFRMTGKAMTDDGNGNTYLQDAVVATVYRQQSGIETGEINLNGSVMNSGIRMYGAFDNENNGSATSHIALDGSGNYVYLWGRDGQVEASGEMSASAFNQTSDARLKKNVSTLTSGLALVNQLRGVRYNWKDEAKAGNKVGFIAQEVEAVLPELVVTKKDGFKAVNYAEMSAVLVEAVKELSRQIDELKRENSDLKAELTKADELESRLAKIEAMLAMDDSKETVKAGQK